MAIGLNGASAFALAGIQAASERAFVRSVNIVNASTPEYAPARPVQTTGPSGAPRVEAVQDEPVPIPDEYQSLVRDNPGLFSQVDLATELVDLQQAKRAFQASVSTLKTVDEMFEALLDIET